MLALGGSDALIVLADADLEGALAATTWRWATRPDLPLGGVERSGLGREPGRSGLEEFADKVLTRLPAV